MKNIAKILVLMVVVFTTYSCSVLSTKRATVPIVNRRSLASAVGGAMGFGNTFGYGLAGRDPATMDLSQTSCLAVDGHSPRWPTTALTTADMVLVLLQRAIGVALTLDSATEDWGEGLDVIATEPQSLIDGENVSSWHTLLGTPLELEDAVRAVTGSSYGVGEANAVIGVMSPLPTLANNSTKEVGVRVTAPHSDVARLVSWLAQRCLPAEVVAATRAWGQHTTYRCSRLAITATSDVNSFFGTPCEWLAYSCLNADEVGRACAVGDELFKDDGASSFVESIDSTTEIIVIDVEWTSPRNPGKSTHPQHARMYAEVAKLTNQTEDNIPLREMCQRSPRKMVDAWSCLDPYHTSAAVSRVTLKPTRAPSHIATVGLQAPCKKPNTPHRNVGLPTAHSRRLADVIGVPSKIRPQLYVAQGDAEERYLGLDVINLQCHGVSSLSDANKRSGGLLMEKITARLTEAERRKMGKPLDHNPAYETYYYAAIIAHAWRAKYPRSYSG
jgi:hypothetical protein